MFQRRLPVAACILLLSWVQAVAEEPIKVAATDWPEQVNQGDLLILDAPTADSFDWGVTPLRAVRTFDRVTDLDEDTVNLERGAILAVETSKSGSFAVGLSYSVDNIAYLMMGTVEVVGSDQDQDDEDQDDEDQDDEDQDQDGEVLPPAEELWGMVLYRVHDVDNHGPEMAQVILGVRLRGLDDRFRWMPNNLTTIDETGDCPEDVEPWLEMLEDKELETPHLFLIDEEGRLRYNSVLPGKVDEVITLVREYLPL